MPESIATIQALIEAIQARHRRIPELWFRGQKKDWAPLPAILRPEYLGGLRRRDPTPAALLDIERLLNNRYRSEVASMVPAGLSHAETYVHSQHAGLKTRLLDWTTNVLVALHAATEMSASGPETDGCIYVVDPGTLCEDPHNFPGVMSIGLPKLDQLIEGTVFGIGEPFCEPVVVPVRPRLTSTRHFVQQSRLTFHVPVRPSKGGLKKEPGATIRNAQKLIVKATDKASLRESLRVLGVSEASLYADPDSVAKRMAKDFDFSDPSAPVCGWWVQRQLTVVVRQRGGRLYFEPRSWRLDALLGENIKRLLIVTIIDREVRYETRAECVDGLNDTWVIPGPSETSVDAVDGSGLALHIEIERSE